LRGGHALVGRNGEGGTWFSRGDRRAATSGVTDGTLDGSLLDSIQARADSVAAAIPSMGVLGWIVVIVVVVVILVWIGIIH
jgi:hypothetical protein